MPNLLHLISLTQKHIYRSAKINMINIFEQKLLANPANSIHSHIILIILKQPQLGASYAELGPWIETMPKLVAMSSIFSMRALLLTKSLCTWSAC